jgi:hypothetical protein
LFASSFDMSSMEGSLRWENAVAWKESIRPLLQRAATYLVFYWIATLLPMSVFPRMRPIIVKTLRISSWFIAGVCWWDCCIVAYRLIGWLPVMMSLLFGGVGVIPLALVTAAARNDWAIFADLATTLAFAIIPRIIARIMAQRIASAHPADHARDYYVDEYDS